MRPSLHDHVRTSSPTYSSIASPSVTGPVSLLKSLHDELDHAVLEAYGWSDLAQLMETVNGDVGLPCLNPDKVGTPLRTRAEARRAHDDALLDRLVLLNARRAAEQKKGKVRWLGRSSRILKGAWRHRPRSSSMKQTRSRWQSPPAGCPGQQRYRIRCALSRRSFRSRRHRLRIEIIETLIAAGRVRSVKDGSAFVAAQ